jgi:hypothetical protein
MQSINADSGGRPQNTEAKCWRRRGGRIGVASVRPEPRFLHQPFRCFLLNVLPLQRARKEASQLPCRNQLARFTLDSLNCALSRQSPRAKLPNDYKWVDAAASGDEQVGDSGLLRPQDALRPWKSFWRSKATRCVRPGSRALTFGSDCTHREDSTPDPDGADHPVACLRLMQRWVRCQRAAVRFQAPCCLFCGARPLDHPPP